MTDVVDVCYEVHGVYVDASGRGFDNGRTAYGDNWMNSTGLEHGRPDNDYKAVEMSDSPVRWDDMRRSLCITARSPPGLIVAISCGPSSQ